MWRLVVLTHSFFANTGCESFVTTAADRSTVSLVYVEGWSESCDIVYLLGQGGRRPGQQQLQRAVLDLLQQRWHAQAPLTACTHSMFTG